MSRVLRSSQSWPQGLPNQCPSPSAANRTTTRKHADGEQTGDGHYEGSCVDEEALESPYTGPGSGRAMAAIPTGHYVLYRHPVRANF
jgi:hypothetical protein